MLTKDAIRFLHLHSHLVVCWQGLFQGAMVRAETDRGVTATLPARDVESLVSAGLLAQGWGGSFYLTEAGRAV